jgi:PAS domain S-box-containing protein
MVALAGGAVGGRDGEQLGDALKEWRSLGVAIPDILLLVDRAGAILYANRTPASFRLNELIGTDVLDLALPGMRAELRRALAETFDLGSTGARELPARHPDGTEHWYAVHAGPVRHGGPVVATVIVARDITDRVAAVTALRESEDRYRTLVEHAPEAIVILDADTCLIVDANPNACALFDLPPERLLGSNPVELSPPVQPNGDPSPLAALQRINQALDGGLPVFDWVHRTGAGTDRRCEVRLVRLPATGRRLLRGSITDVSRQRQLEAHLAQTQKLEALGQLAGGIAHDFNNILLVITMSADQLAGRIHALPECREEVETIRSAARRGAAFTRQLLAFARHQRPEVERLDLHGVIRDVTAMLTRVLGAGVEVVTRLAPEGACVRAGRGQLEQILMNLILNARDAMPSGGRITVTTRRGDAAIGPAVYLEVEDTGTGMDEWTRQRVFDPLFTTKGPDQGTGLGLSTVHAIVTQLGGEVTAESLVGVGSRFIVVLPASQLR